MLDKQSVKILMFLNVNGITTIEQLSNQFSTTSNIQKVIDFLCEIQYIKGLTPKYTSASGFHKIDDIKIQIIYCSPYEITPKGVAYLELLETEHPRTLKGKMLKWFKNNALEIIAIIISIIALLKP